MSVKAERKQRTHEAILASAARLVRERGIDAASVADVMKGAGLTVGGFYAHFASKEALVADTLRATLRETRARLFRGVSGATPAARAASMLRRYLSREHRDAVAEGCPLPSTVAEVARDAEPVRAALAEELEQHAVEIAELIGGAGARGRALALLALMVGGLTLARALRGSPLGDELLRAAAQHGRDLLPE